MSQLRMPQAQVRRLGVESTDAGFRHELMEEQAYSLGRAGKKVETTLAALREIPAGRAALRS